MDAPHRGRKEPVKCIKCSHDSKAKERPGGVCPSCGTRFAFDPQAGDPFTDPAFAAAIERVSSGGAVRFTEDHLYYELARVHGKRQSPAAVWVIGAIVLAFVGGGVLWAVVGSPMVIIGPALLAALMLVRAVTAKPVPLATLPRDMFQRLWQKWSGAHGTPPKLIASTAVLPPRDDAARALPKELGTYSFDRAVVCDRQETVDMLLANNFHFENNCAVLSVGGYPHAVFPQVLQMLRRNPKIEVYALHDASLDGVGLARMLASSPEWFKGIGRVTDVGLSVAHAQEMRGLWLRSSDSSLLGTTDRVGPEELAWLTVYRLELASVRPEQVIKRLFRAMTQPGTAFEYQGDTYYVCTSSGDASTSDGGGDSFG
jgi:hypothetical protein